MGGQDKALLSLAGRPLIAHVIDRLGCARAISANGDPARFADFGLPVLGDEIPGWPGPLAGVLAGMDWAAGNGFAYILTAAADTPFFPRDLAERLGSVNAPVVLARAMTPDGLRPHPTFALWDVSLRDDLRAALGQGVRRVREYAAKHGAVLVDIPGDDPFFNINTPEDMGRARTRTEDKLDKM